MTVGWVPQHHLNNSWSRSFVFKELVSSFIATAVFFARADPFKGVFSLPSCFTKLELSSRYTLSRAPSVLGVPDVDGHVRILVPGVAPLLVHGGDGLVTIQELVSPDPPRRKEVILTLDSHLQACGNSLEQPLNFGPPLGHRDGDGKLLPSGLDKITNQTGDLHVTQLLPGTGPPLRHFQG